MIFVLQAMLSRDREEAVLCSAAPSRSRLSLDLAMSSIGIERGDRDCKLQIANCKLQIARVGMRSCGGCQLPGSGLQFAFCNLHFAILICTPSRS